MNTLLVFKDRGKVFLGGLDPLLGTLLVKTNHFSSVLERDPSPSNFLTTKSTAHTAFSSLSLFKRWKNSQKNHIFLPTWLQQLIWFFDRQRFALEQWHTEKILGGQLPTTTTTTLVTSKMCILFVCFLKTGQNQKQLCVCQKNYFF
jgi:hypothetical protein